MNIDKSSLAYRLLVPLFGVIAVISITLLLLISLITDHIIDDYYRSTLAAYSDDVASLLDSALAELSTARLLDNRTVTEAKQQAVLEAMQLNWKYRGIVGTVTGPGNKTLFSSLPPEQTAWVASQPLDELFRIKVGGRVLRGQGMLFPPWSWKIYLFASDLRAMSGFSRQAASREALYLVPIVAIGAILMVAMLFFILQKRLRGPVMSMTASLQAEREIGPTGVAEFDRIGGAVNEAMNRVKERTDAALRQEERIQLLLDSTAEGIYGVDMNGDCTFCNAACLSLLGFEHEDELLGKNVHSLIHHTHADGRAYLRDECAIYSAYRMRREVHVDSEVFWRRDGTPMPVEYWSYPVIKEDRVRGAVVTFIDITERRQSEAALLQERNKFEAIIAALGDAISMQDKQYRVLYQNDVHRRLRGDCMGKPCYEAYMLKNDVCPGCQLALAFADGGVHTAERRVQLQGEDRYFEITASPVRDASGEIVAGLELVRDVTARKRTEAQLMQAQKMEAVGRLAGGIAHDFNNVLSAVVGYASLVKKQLAEGSRPYYYTEQILHATERATGLTRQILAFSRKQVLDPRPTDLNQIVRGVEPFMTRILGEDIEVRTALAPQSMTVLADTSQLEQVLMNLATNARDAMPQGGSLIIRTERVDVDQAYAEQNGLDWQGVYAVLSCSDTGCGMDEKTRSQIFEPFFTTKDVGRGTGLGLAIVYGIITQHNGHVSVYSEPDKGTTFRIYLPLTASEAETPSADAQGEVRGGTETILVVEDNQAVSGALRATLEEQGYRVIEARDGEDAVRVFREHAADVKLCLLDVIMPKKNGKDAYREICALRGDVKAIFMSGYTADVIQSNDLLQKNIVFVSKPLVPRKLLALVRDVLDRP